jgi:hypothetical protein
MRHVLTCADDGGRVIITPRACRRPLLICAHVRREVIAFPGCRMLLEGGVDGHLKPILRTRCGVCLLGPRDYEIAHLEVLIFPKMTSVPLRRGGNEKRRNYVQVGGFGGEVYQIAVHPRNSDYHWDQTGSLEHLGRKGIRNQGLSSPITIRAYDA